MRVSRWLSALLILWMLSPAMDLFADEMAPSFTDVTDRVGLGSSVVPETVSRLCQVDLNADGWPDVVIDRWRVFINRSSDTGRHFVEIPAEKTGLSKPDRSSVTSFADLDNDGFVDAVVAEHIDAKNTKWMDHGRRTGWHRGHGDGTFGERQLLPTPPRTTISIAVGDVNGDGWLDLYFGNTYELYGATLVGYPNDLLLSTGDGHWKREPLPEDTHEFDEEHDLGGRPTFGTAIVDFGQDLGLLLLDMSYGRRWNRAWQRRDGWRDIAPVIGFDGDAIRHGKYPEWLKERAKSDKRFDRADEKPFRANGNTFDVSVDDVDGDGHFDLFVSTIAHGWAGESSDRSRFLLNRVAAGGGRRFVYDPQLCVDRIPPKPASGPHNFNQGDLFCELADLDNDGRLDLVLSSGDYPDDQRLRVYQQQADGQFVDKTKALGIDHDGSQQVSLGDFDRDGDLDILVGQTFNRFRKEQREGRKPRIRLFRNDWAKPGTSIVIRLDGRASDPAAKSKAVNRDALGTHGCATIVEDGHERTLLRRVHGVGGHAGKQQQFLLHFGLGMAKRARELTITWPGGHEMQRFSEVAPGEYTLTPGGVLQKAEPQGQ